MAFVCLLEEDLGCLRSRQKKKGEKKNRMTGRDAGSGGRKMGQAKNNKKNEIRFHKKVKNWTKNDQNNRRYPLEKCTFCNWPSMDLKLHDTGDETAMSF